MKKNISITCLFGLGIALSCAAREHLLQSPAGRPHFEPTVGQPGKDVIWVPTNETLVNKMLDLAKVTPDDFLIDLGSGDGRTVIAAAKRGARALGIEYNPDMVELSRRNAAKEGVAGKAQFEKADIFESDLSRATVITMFLLEDINLRLRPKLLELKPGTRIVSNTFAMGDWECDDKATVEEGAFSEGNYYNSFRTALLWVVPAKVAGTWRMPGGELVLKQTFQAVAGALTEEGRKHPVTNGKVKGMQIEFSTDDSEYSGTLDGTRILGTVRRGSGSAPWNAVLGPNNK